MEYRGLVGTDFIFVESFADGSQSVIKIDVIGLRSLAHVARANKSKRSVVGPIVVKSYATTDGAAKAGGR